MKKYSVFLIIIMFSLFLNSCKYDFILPEEVAPIDTSKPTSFATDIVPIFADKCTACHNVQTPVMTSAVAYAQLVPSYVNTTSPSSSKVYINASSGTHFATVSATQAALILKWITEGAKNN